jgi:cell division septation protein DedD
MAYEFGSIEPEGGSGLHAGPRDEEPPRQQRRVLAIFVALVVMGLFAGGLWFAYSKGAQHSTGAVAESDVPLIRADPRPTKIKPEEPGGMQIPDRDKLIYAQTRSAQARPAVEHLLPPPEKPMPRPVAASPTAEMPAAAPPQVAETPKPAEPTPPPAKPPQSAAAAPPKPTPARLPPPRGAGGARVQLGSVRSEDQARQEWSRIKRQNADLLGNLSATPIRADLGDKGVYYRIQVGPVGDTATAEHLCGELKQRSVGCILVR